MPDVMFSDAPEPAVGALHIDEMLYQSRPMESVDRTIRSVRREWRTFLVPFVLVTLLGAMFVVLSPRQYSAEAIVRAAPRQQNLSRPDAISSSAIAPESTAALESGVEGELATMTSSSALREVVQKLKLDEFKSGDPVDRSPLPDLIESIRVLIGVDSKGNGREVSFDTIAQGILLRIGIKIDLPEATPPDRERLTTLAIERLSLMLKVEPVGRSSLVRIQCKAGDPRLAAEIATAVAQNYIDDLQRERLDIAARASEWLLQRTVVLRTEAVNAEDALAAFRTKTVIQGRDAAQFLNDTKTLSQQIAVAKAEQGKALSQLAVAKQRIDSDGGGPLDLKMRVEAATREVKTLEEQLELSRATYDQLEAATSQLGTYENAAAATHAVYEDFLRRSVATQQVGFNEAQGWLVAPAGVPSRPSAPNIPVVMLGTLVLAVGTGIARVMKKEYRDSKTIRTLEDIDRHFPGMRSLGLLPELPGRYCGVGELISAINSGLEPEFTEAARGLYTSLTAAIEQDRGGAGGRVVLVSSALPSEGKSSTVGVIASIAGAAGKRVLVIDCDFRRPTLHGIVALAPSSGLAGYLEQGTSASEVIREGWQAGVWIIPAGQTSQSPQRLLQSPGLSTLLAALKGEFDVILMDTPPILGLSDAWIVSRLADHRLLVISWCRTSWTATKLAMQTLSQSGRGATGLILTRVDVDRLATFKVPEAEAYGKRYRSYYSKYYNVSTFPNAGGQALTRQAEYFERRPRA